MTIAVLAVVAAAVAEPVRFGCAYYPEAWDEARWEADLDDMKGIGISSVRVGEFNWSGFEPSEGKFDFSAYERFLALCNEKGIDVMMCTPTAAIPPWLRRNHPDVEKRDEHGRPPPLGSRQSRCPSSPAFRAAALRLAERMAAAFCRFKCVKHWQIDNELHITAGLGVCCCRACEQGFRDWLRSRYSTIDGLNKAWNHAFWSSRFTDWDEITLPISKVRETWQVEFVRYLSDAYLRFAIEQRDAILRRDPNAVVTSNGSEMSGWLRLDTLYGALGFVAVDTYAEGAMRDRARWMWGLARGLSGRQAPFMVAETGAFSWDADSDDADEVVGEWLDDAVRHGARHYYFFRWRQSVNGEQYHPAILPWSGRKGAAYRRVRRVIEDFRKRERAGLAPAFPARSAVAILHSNESDQDALVRSGKVQFGLYEDAHIRLNAALERRGVLPDYVVASERADISGYGIVFIPVCTMLPASMVSKIRAYVNGGGTAVAIARLNMVDPLGGSYRKDPYPAGLVDVFGLEISEQRAFPWKDYALDRIEPQTCRVLRRMGGTAFKGEPDLTVNAFGRGKAYYKASLSKDEKMDDLLEAVMK